MSIRKLFVLAVLAMSVSPLVHAENVATSPELKQSLEKLFGRQPDSVSQAPIPGLLEVQVFDAWSDLRPEFPYKYYG